MRPLFAYNGAFFNSEKILGQAQGDDRSWDFLPQNVRGRPLFVTYHEDWHKRRPSCEKPPSRFRPLQDGLWDGDFDLS